MQARTRISPAADGAPSARRESASRIACGAALASLALAALVAAPVARSEPAAQSATAPAAAPGTFKPTKAQLDNLKLVTIARTTFREEHITDGKIALNADRTTPVFSPYSGRVTKVLVGLGENVKQGEPLLSLQASEFVQGQSDLLTAQAGVASAHAQLSMAVTTEQRKHALYEAKAGALQDWQQSQSDLAAAQSASRTAEAALAAVRNRLSILGKSDAQIDELASAGKMDPVAYVLAPISGTVTDRQVGPGQYLQAGAGNPVYTVGDLSNVWLVASVRETDAPYVRKGDTVEVHVVALPERSYSARVTYVSPTLDPSSRRVTVRAEIANGDGMLKPEMFASFTILSGSPASAPAVPASGVIYEGSDARVWIAGDDGTLSLRKIKAGRSANGLLEVLDGVKPGEKVVASGALFIDRAAEGD